MPHEKLKEDDDGVTVEVTVIESHCGESCIVGAVN